MRRFKAMAGALLLGVSLSGCWVQLGNGPGRTYWKSDETTITAANVDQLEQLWDTTVGASIPSTPISVGGSIYTSLGTKAFAIDAANGAVRWDAGPFEVTTPFGTTQPGLSRPVEFQGNVVVPYAFYENSFSQGSGLFALAKADGSLLDPVEGRGYDVIVKGDALATMHSQVAGTSGFKTTTVDWAFSPGWVQSVSESSPAIAFVGETIVATTMNVLQGFDVNCPPAPAPVGSCTPTWQLGLGATATTAPAAVGDDQVVAGAQSGVVTVADAATGTLAWTGNAGAPVTGSPTVTDDTIVVGAADGRLVAFPREGCGAATCAPLWEGTVGSTPRGHLVAAGDVVYTVTDTGALVAFAVDGCGTASCPALKTIAANAAPTTGIIVDDGRVVVGTASGHVIAYGITP